MELLKPGLFLAVLLTVGVHWSSQQDDILTRCRTAMDIIIAVDGSNSMGYGNFALQLQSITNMVNNLEVSDDNIHVGAVLFSDEASNIIPLSPNKQTFISTMLAWPYPDQGTRTDLAINAARDMFVQQGRGTGTEVPHVLIVVTDGASTQPTLTQSEATLAKNEGIQIFAVGVGNAIDINELNYIASAPQDVFMATDFSQLENELILAAEQICIDLAPPPVPACYMGYTDIWWVVDQSTTAEVLSRLQYTYDFASLKQGVMALINIVQDPSVYNPGVRMGLVTYSDYASTLVTTSVYSSVSETATGIQAIPGGIPVGGSNLLTALQQIQVGPQQSQWYSYVAVVTPQSAFNNYSPIQTELNRLRSLGYQIVLFTVADTASAISNYQIETLASGLQYNFYISSYALLDEATSNFTRDMLCAAPPATAPPATTPAAVAGDGICAGSMYQVNGMDVIAHPTDCDKYIQCYWDATTGTDFAIVMTCPAGLFWDQNLRTCVMANQTSCATDQCQEDCDAYAMTEGPCGAFWDCVNGVSTPMCCEPNYRFIPEQGCVYDATCVDKCELEQWCDICNKKPNFENLYGYDVVEIPPATSTSLATWAPRHCDYHYYDPITCDCTWDMGQACPWDRDYDFRDSALTTSALAGTVEGLFLSEVNYYSGVGISIGANSAVHVDANKLMPGQPWTLIVTFSEVTAFDPYGEVILTSGMNCGAENGLVVSADSYYIYASVYYMGTKVVALKVPYQGISAAEYKTVGVQYADMMLLLWVNGGNQQYYAYGNAPYPICLACGIDIGGGLNEQSFSGTVQEVAVASCKVAPYEYYL